MSAYGPRPCSGCGETRDWPCADDCVELAKRRGEDVAGYSVIADEPTEDLAAAWQAMVAAHPQPDYISVSRWIYDMALDVMAEETPAQTAARQRDDEYCQIGDRLKSEKDYGFIEPAKPDHAAAIHRAMRH